LIFYFLGRYSLLGALVGILVALNVTVQVDCQALYTVNQLLGNAAIGAASINLSIRTIAVWSQNKWVIFPIVAIILGHWSLLLHGILLKAEWEEGVGCVITQTSNTILAGTFIYTMSFDFVILSLTAWKLAIAPSGRSRLVTLIFGDGLIYFLIAFSANALATVFMLLDLNPVMSIIFNVPAAVASTIMACRAVRRLTKFTSSGPEVFQSTGQNSGIAFRSATRGGGPTTVSIKKPTQSGVHVQMDTFTMQDNEAQNGESFLEYDVNGNVKARSARGHSDIEAQEIVEDFKRPPYY